MNSPTLDPFSSRSNSGSSAGALVIVALVLGIATAAGVYFLKSPHKEEKVGDSLAQLFDVGFKSTEIDAALQELRDAKERYEVKSKDLIATQLRVEAEKEDLARLQKDIEAMRRQLSEEIRNASAIKSPVTPQKTQ